MQASNVSLGRQSFALGCRCSSSREKKPRLRKTKEERRTMVESFIHKYRRENSGNFPSLNLTHKEVGGSFYIIREIVRDIIQENRVLGPGDMTMTALSFDDCHTHDVPSNQPDFVNSSDADKNGMEVLFSAGKTYSAGSSELLSVNFLSNLQYNGATAYPNILDDPLHHLPNLADTFESVINIESVDESHEHPSSLPSDSNEEDIVAVSNSSSLTTDDHADILLEDSCSPLSDASATKNSTFHLNSYESEGPCNLVVDKSATDSEGVSMNSTHDYLMRESLHVHSNIQNFLNPESLGVQSSILVSGDSEWESHTGIPPTSIELCVMKSTADSEILSEISVKDLTVQNTESSEIETSVIETKEQQELVEVNHDELVAETHTEPELMRTDISAVSNSDSTKREQHKVETNPIWATFKAMIQAVLKFWTE